MKHQYFGDRNDYRKYGLLRILSDGGRLTTAVCWMLTAPDERPGGQRTEYLREPARWRSYDPALFDALRRCLASPGDRHVGLAETVGIVPGAVFFAEPLTDEPARRRAYFERFLSAAQRSDLAFFDPDIGLEVPSIPYGRRHSSRYLYWHELVRAYANGHSTLVYQHFARQERDTYTAALAAELCRRTGAPQVISFRTANVLFLLAPQPRHLEGLRVQSEAVSDAWRPLIEVAHHTASTTTP